MISIMNTEHETSISTELEKTKPAYETNLSQFENLNRHLMDSLLVKDIRWDATSPMLFPPEIFTETEKDSYADTLDGRAEMVALQISSYFIRKKITVSPQILIFGLADTFIPATQRLEKVFPNKKSEVTALMTQTALLTLRNIQLDQKTKPRSSHDTQLMDLLIDRLNNYGPPELPSISSTEQDFMNLEYEVLSNFFHTKVEEKIGPENDEDFMFVRKAVRLAEKSHGDQKRFDGTLNKTHILRLGIRLLEDPAFMKDRAPLKIKLSSALLHDVVEDTNTTLIEIEERLGTEVKNAVNSLSRSVRTTGERRTDEEYYEGLSQQPKFVQEIKGHDRVDNLEALLQLDLNSEDRIEIIEKGIKYLDETYRFYYDLVSDSPYLLHRLQKAHHAAIQFYPKVEEFVV